MKKFLTAANLARCLAFVLGVVGFCMMFTNQLYVELLGARSYMNFQDALFGVQGLIGSSKGATLSFVGYLLIAFAALGTCCSTLIPAKKDNKGAIFFLNIVLALLFVAGGVFVILEATIYNSANDLKSMYNLAIGPILAAVFAFVSGLLVCGSLVLPTKSLVK